MFTITNKNVQKFLDEVRERLEDYEKDVVVCEECGVLVSKYMARDVRNIYGREYGESSMYCNRCKPNYDKVIHTFPHLDLPTKYYKEIEVTKDGEPVGYNIKRGDELEEKIYKICMKNGISIGVWDLIRNAIRKRI